MFDEEYYEGDALIEFDNPEFRIKEDYGGGLDDQRTNQDEMDQLMKPCLDFDDDEDEEEEEVDGYIGRGGAAQLLKPKLGGGNGGLASSGAGGDKGGDNMVEKYFSNGDVDRGHINKDDTNESGAGAAKAVFSKRNGRKTAGRLKRYSSEDDDDFDDDNVC